MGVPAHTLSWKVPAKTAKKGKRDMSRNTRNSKRRNATLFGPGTLQGSTRIDALRDYSRSNDELLNEDPTLSSILHLISTKLFTSGLAFFVNNKWHIPDDDFMFIVRNYWEAFMFRAFSFILAHGYLVWYPAKISESVIVPEVPDFSQITVDMYYDERSGQAVMNAAWKNDKTTTPLKIFHRSLPFRVTPENRLSVVDKVKPLLRMLYQLTEARVVASHMNANPPMVVQRTKQQDPSKKGVQDELSVQDPVLEFEDKYLLELGIDETFVERLQMTASNPMYQTYVGKEETQTMGPSHWWEKAELAMQRRPESRFLFVPGGLQFVNSTPGHVDPDYSKMREGIVEEIYHAFGIPPSMVTSHTSKVSVGVEMHTTTFLNTMQMWWRIYSLLMTDVFRVLYGTADVPNLSSINKDTLRKSGEDTIAKEIDGEGKLFRKVNDNGAPKGVEQKSSKSVTVYLRSQFVTSPEQVEKLYSQKVIPFGVFQRLRTDSIGVPEMLIDPSLTEPLELAAQEEILLSGGGMGSTLKPDALGGFDGNGVRRPSKRAKTSGDT